MNGNYEPKRPEQFVCQESIALIVSKTGDIEVFGRDEKCNQMVANAPEFSFNGHSVNLLDNYLVIATSIYSSSEWWYHSLRAARGGLLANPWEHTNTTGDDAPIRHISFVYGNNLVMLGGEANSQVMIETGRDVFGQWKTKTLSLTWPNRKYFEFSIKDACVVKVAMDSFFVLGGRNTSSNQIKSAVLNINMTSQTVAEVGSLLYPRTQHACAVFFSPSSINKMLVLVTGGKSDSSSARDEVFDPDKAHSRTIRSSLSFPRLNHQMVNMGGKVFALGGQRQPGDNSRLDIIEVFDVNSETWSLHTTNLLTQSTDGLAVTEMPRSAVFCSQGCRCGVRSSARIVGGEPAQVDTIALKDILLTITQQAQNHPWLGLIIVEEKVTRIRSSQCTGQPGLAEDENSGGFSGNLNCAATLVSFQ